MNRPIQSLHTAYTQFFRTLTTLFGGSLLPLLARLTLAGVFWRSLLTKVETFGVFNYTEYINDFAIERSHVKLPVLPLELKAATLHQFAAEFALPLLPASAAAWMATIGEFILPILLLLGLMTRFAALGLIVMTLVIQFFVYPEAWWGSHALWMVMAGYLVVNGPGRLSIDHTLGNRFAA
ncbi:MAG: DoxX family protein [Alphaproteobacteria bacterium]|nr:DoxX family protein [Alphaproteobacteria bacterium]